MQKCSLVKFHFKELQQNKIAHALDLFTDFQRFTHPFHWYNTHPLIWHIYYSTNLFKNLSVILNKNQFVLMFFNRTH
jgi:hypothetical protein